MSMTGRLVIRAMFACTRAIVHAIEEAHSGSKDSCYWFNLICGELDEAEEEILK